MASRRTQLRDLRDNDDAAELAHADEFKERRGGSFFPSKSVPLDDEPFCRLRSQVERSSKNIVACVGNTKEDIFKANRKILASVIGLQTESVSYWDILPDGSILVTSKQSRFRIHLKPKTDG